MTSSPKNALATIFFNPVIGDQHLSYLFNKNLVCKSNQIDLESSQRKKFDKAYLFLHQLIRHRFISDTVEITVDEDHVECKDVFLVENHKDKHGNPDHIHIVKNNHYKLHPDVFTAIKKYRQLLSELFVLTEACIQTMLIDQHESVKSLYVQLEFGHGYDEEEEEEEEGDDEEEEDEEEEDEDEEQG
jgi:hypothetical protein